MRLNSYTDCLAIAQTKKRKLANNTYLREGDGYFSVRLHATDIVTYHADGRIVLNSGGWRTHTTKERMNEFSPISIWAKAGIWFCQLGSGAIHAFADEIAFHADGTVTGAGTDPDAQRKARNRIIRYARDYMKAFAAGKVEAPSSGDCWCCAMRDQNGRVMGDNDPTHLDSHISEHYLVPSLLANAINDRPGSVSDAARGYVGAVWSGQPRGELGWYEKVAVPQLRTALANYILHRFGMTPSRTVYSR